MIKLDATTTDKNDPRPAYAVEILEATEAFNKYLSLNYSGCPQKVTHEQLWKAPYHDIILPYEDSFIGGDLNLLITATFHTDQRHFIVKSEIEVYARDKEEYLWASTCTVNHESRPEFKIEPRFSEKYGVYVF